VLLCCYPAAYSCRSTTLDCAVLHESFTPPSVIHSQGLTILLNMLPSGWWEHGIGEE
jgi:hypothetical protein